MLASPTFRSSFKEKERDVLNLFTVEGEGGYDATEYSFMFKGSAFFTPAIANSVANVVKDDTRIKSFVIPSTSTTVKYMDNVLRVVLGNNNQCIMYRDGKVDIDNNNYDYPYMRTIMYDIKDTFCPSSYSTGGGQFQQMLLLNNGDLIYVNTYTRTAAVTALTGVQKFLTKNQAHRSDAIVGCTNGDVYHVWVGPTPVNSGSYNDGNGTASGVIKINGIKHTDLLFCTIGDAPANCIFCLKSDPQKLYRFVKGYGTNFKITGLQTTPITANSGYENLGLTGDEYYIGGMAQEFNSLFLTNKRMIHRSTSFGSNYNDSYKISTWAYGWEKELYPTISTAANPTIAAKKIVTPTAYSMIIEDTNGKYWLCDNTSTDLKTGNAYRLAKPVSYTFFDQLKTYLTPIRDASK
jgi:hypothetical protein